MTTRERLLAELTDIANNPQNEYDRIIAENKRFLLVLPLKDLNALSWRRKRACKLCKAIPYTREDLQPLFENNEVAPFELVAELEDTLAIVEYIFSKVNGQKY